MAKIKKPAPKKGGPAKPATTKKPMRRKSKRASALPHVDVPAPKRAHASDESMQPRAGKTKAVEREFGKRLTVEEQFDYADRLRMDAANGLARRASRLAATAMEGVNLPAKRTLWSRFRSGVKRIFRFRSASTGEYVTKEYAEANPDTTVRERSS